MEAIVDSSIWVDYFRPKTPKSVKAQAVEIVNSASVVLCEPVWFEIVRGAPAASQPLIESVFSTLPILPAPIDLWSDAAKLGKKCTSRGLQVSGMDLLIAQVALHFEVELVTFDTEFETIQKVSPLKLRLVQRSSS